MLPIYFAPLQGYTDCAYRNAHDNIFGGVSEYYTPFIRIERGNLRPKDVREILLENDTTGKVIPQIIVKDVGEFIFIVDSVADVGHRRIDVNMGCPYPMQTHKGRGAGLLSNKESFVKILKAINERENIEFSIKMRLGNEKYDEALNLIPILNDTRLKHITMHPRVAIQQYKGEVNLEKFGEFQDRCNHKIIYNGDVASIEDINRIESRFPKVGGIMIGRGLLQLPSLAIEYVSGKSFTDDEKIQRVMQLHEELYEHYSCVLQGDSHLLIKMKTFWEYLENIIGHRKYKAIKKSVSMAKYNIAIANI